MKKIQLLPYLFIVLLLTCCGIERPVTGDLIVRWCDEETIYYKKVSDGQEGWMNNTFQWPCFVGDTLYFMPFRERY